jgi:hypothetical protein
LSKIFVVEGVHSLRWVAREVGSYISKESLGRQICYPWEIQVLGDFVDGTDVFPLGRR